MRDPPVESHPLSFWTTAANRLRWQHEHRGAILTRKRNDGARHEDSEENPERLPGYGRKGGNPTYSAIRRFHNRHARANDHWEAKPREEVSCKSILDSRTKYEPLHVAIRGVALRNVVLHDSEGSLDLLSVPMIESNLLIIIHSLNATRFFFESTSSNRWPFWTTPSGKSS